MSATQAVQLILGLAELVLRLLPAKDRVKAEREVRDHFVKKHLDKLDDYARGKRR